MTQQRPRNALIVDWDFFFPIDDHWDWQFGENDFYINTIWPIRASHFLMKNEPYPEVLDDYRSFWQRFAFAEGAPFYYADSNVHAYTAIMHKFGAEPLDGLAVWSFDQHHDCGYKGKLSRRKIVERQGIDCEDWLLATGQLTGPEGLHVVYPRHADLSHEPKPYFDIDRRYDSPDLELPERFDLVFVCRSGAWVPPWEDGKFFGFVAAAPTTGQTIVLDDIGRRPWGVEQQQAARDIARGMADVAAGRE